MRTHEDRDATSFMERLKERSEQMRSEGRSEIAGGKEGEESLAEWKSHGVYCRHMPDDEQGILRISVGGGTDTPVKLEYCTIRGSIGQCIDLLRRAIKALKDAP